MALSTKDQEYLASGSGEVDATLQQELGEVHATYFSQFSYTGEDSSEDSEEERSDNDEGNDLFDHSVAARAGDLAQDTAHDVGNSNENPDSDLTVKSFVTTTCGCTLGPNKQSCSRLFTESVMIELRSQCLELTSEELDLVILGNLAAQTRTDQTKKQKRLNYYVRGNEVCRKTFLFLNGISKKRLSNLKTQLRVNGITPRIHGNTKSKPHNRIPHTSLERVVTFIENYTEREGLSLPGRVPGYKSFRIKLLPTSTSKAELWRCYTEAAEAGGYAGVGYSKFVDTWNGFLPSIKIMQPPTDLCHTCQKNTEKISGHAGASEIEKMAAVEIHQDHLRKARREREIYNSAIDASKALLKGHPRISLLSPNLPCSLKGTVHYSYDYAQQVHYPTNPQQPGPIYFKTPRKCGIFGICCESLPRQINYFIDESVPTGKGANATISYVHDFLENHGTGETSIHFHADNCGGQNKNNYVLWYWCWRIIHGLHENIKYSFLVAGHTKFSPDWCFRLMKQRVRRTFISSLFDIIEANDKSTISGVNCGKLVGLHDGTVIVKSYDWAKHLGQYFKKMPGVSKIHHFRFTKDHPGKVFCSESGDSPEKEFQMLKDVSHLPPRDLPSEISPSGLDEERKNYLYREIREFCRPGTEDLVAPAP